jgi:ATP-binding cassette subfamily B protein
VNETSPDQNNEKYEKVSFNEFFQISKWTTKIIFSIHPVYSVLYIVFGFLSNVRGLVNSFILAKILDTLVRIAQTPNANVTDLYPTIGVLIIVNVAYSIIDFLDAYTSRTLEIISSPLLHRALYTKLNSLGIQTLERPEINDKIHRAGGYINSVLRYYRQLADLFSYIGGTLVTMGIIARYAPEIVPIIVVLTIPRYLNDKKYRTLAWKLDYETTEEYRKASSTSGNLSSTGTLQEIFINNAFGFLDKKYMDFQNWYVKASLDIRKKWFLGLYFYNFIGNFGIYFGFLRIFSSFIKGLVSLGDVYFQVNTLQTFQRNLYQTFGTFNSLFDFSVRVKDVYILFQAEPAFQDGDIDLGKLDKGPSIEFVDVNFKYPRGEKPVIENFNLKINSGEKIAIVGPNGAGKTTLVRLIARMYQVTSGQILINGKDINELKSDTLFQNMGVLLQDFNTHTQLTARENIYLGKSDDPINEDEIIKAAESADALGFIEELPNKFNQILSERFKGGIKLSSGQWQKLAIARFFYRNAPLVIFDEPTASIDAESEFNIFNKIYSFFKNKTVIIISHRFSTVRNADRIIVIRKGQIVEEGNHSELMAKEGEYAKAFLLQAKGYDTSPVETIAN